MAGRQSANHAHGRLEPRVVKVVTVTAGFRFPHAAQAGQARVVTFQRAGLVTAR